tara:strand:+ start:4326 stop:5369 length:1044 start_codon:yes stop_codon:yes gene_type:complete
MNQISSKYICFTKPLSVTVREELVEKPLSGELLCKARKSLISIGTELHCLKGKFQEGTNWFDWVKYPFRPGYSMVSEIIDKGSDTNGFEIGDFIATYDFHQQYFKINLNQTKRNDIPTGLGVYKMDVGLPIEFGTFRSLACTAQNAFRRSNYQLGESVAVVGLGLLGQLLLQYCSIAGASPIVAIDPSEKRTSIAAKANHVFCISKKIESSVQQAIESNDGNGFDIVFDATGSAECLSPSTELLRRFGRLVLIGDTPTPQLQSLGPKIVYNSLSISGIHGYAVPEYSNEFTPWNIQKMSDLFYKYVLNKKMFLNDLITSSISVDESAQKYLDLVYNRTDDVGVIVDW